jgi:hypothetical protein
VRESSPDFAMMQPCAGQDENSNQGRDPSKAPELLTVACWTGELIVQRGRCCECIQ